MTSLPEFLEPLRRGSQREKCLAVLYYFKEHDSTPAMTATEVRNALVRARVPGGKTVNVWQVLSRAGSSVDSATANGKNVRLWHLTDTGLAVVRKSLGLETVPQASVVEVAELEVAVKAIPDDLAQEFVAEAITCIRAGALRAAVVFVWTGAVRCLHDQASAVGWSDVQDAIQKHDPRVKAVKKIEDFAMVNDRTFLLAARDLAMIDKGQWTILQQALDLRNQCGHPSNYKPGPKRVSALVEDLIGVVFT